MKCDNCSSENIRRLYHLSYMNINECKNCGLRFTDQATVPRITYTENYFKNTNKEFFKDSWADYENYISKSKKLKRFRTTLKKLENYADKGNILDLGCATGVFLDMAQKNGWHSYGVEISKFASDYGRKNFNLDIKTGDLMNVKFKDNFFDLVTINDASLMGYLAHLFYKLKIKKFAELVHPKHHNYHFTKKVLIDMLNKNGFEVIYTKKSEMPLENILQGPIVKAMAFILYLFSNLLNQQHEIIIIARKK